MSTVGRISRRRRLSHDMTFADSPAPTDSSLTTVCLDDGMLFKSEEDCSSLSLQPVPDPNPTQPKPVHQGLATVSRSEPGVRTAARQSVHLLPNGMVKIMFPQGNDSALPR